MFRPLQAGEKAQQAAGLGRGTHPDGEVSSTSDLLIKRAFIRCVLLINLMFFVQSGIRRLLISMSQ